MKRISILFILLGLVFISSASLHAQAREIGAKSLALDDGLGHVVDITIPNMTGPGPYSWVLPITPGGSPLSLPTPTVANSILYSNGTNAWLENTNLTATAGGVLTALGITDNGLVTATYAANSGTGVLSVTNTGSAAMNVGETIANTGNGTTAVGLLFNNSGSAATNKYDIQGTGGTTNWYVTSAGNAFFSSLFVQGGAVNFNNIGNPVMNIGDAFYNGTITIGSGTGATLILGNSSTITSITGNTWNVTTGGAGTFSALTASTAASGLVLGSGANATTLSSTATSARAISFPNAPGTLAVSGAGATYQSPGLLPAGTSSFSYVQMGLAGSITPASSGKVLIIISGIIWNNTNGDAAATQISYGTGAAPANGDAATGTVVSGTDVQFYEPATGSIIFSPFSTNVVVTGLTVGTTYWIDLQLIDLFGGTATVGNVNISTIEMP